MCLAVPMKVLEIKKDMAVVSIGQVKKRVNIQMIANLKIGDYIMVHAGFGIEKIDAKEAQKTLELFK
ncbi:MAG: HypC/HybG/HupF family hydrogenase formation chaperone [Candidatus Omnitrophica bacterium]|nr:HypC/HybG/HupF family hydrogenase formation chaperone [Candidatus Omnitrophota bacterium]HOX54097.1 HypC/HybG/HupF family hydrogenase formation chaperone [Candidatus Omnitrophota bacterium]